MCLWNCRFVICASSLVQYALVTYRTLRDTLADSYKTRATDTCNTFVGFDCVTTCDDDLHLEETRLGRSFFFISVRSDGYWKVRLASFLLSLSFFFIFRIEEASGNRIVRRYRCAITQGIAVKKFSPGVSQHFCE